MTPDNAGSINQTPTKENDTFSELSSIDPYYLPYPSLRARAAGSPAFKISS